MKALTTRLVAALCLASLAGLALPGLAAAGEREGHEIRKGVYEGIWHTDPVKIIIEKVERDGSFSGEIHFDPKGRWGDVRAPFHARQGRDGSVTMSRDDCVQPGARESDQVARTGRPERRDRAWIWRGEVHGPDFTSSFELRIPARGR